MKRQKKDKRMKWEYCECGCHGHELRLGPLLYYWMFDDLGRGGSSKNFHLNTGHNGLGDRLGSFSSFEEADRAARAHAESTLKKYLKELDKCREGLNRE